MLRMQCWPLTDLELCEMVLNEAPGEGRVEAPLPPVEDLNLFSSLFEFRTRDGHSPKENFLTEALIYVIRKNPEAMCVWVKLLAHIDVDASSVQISTRLSHMDEEAGTTIYPDVHVSGLDLSGCSFSLIVEHKWDSPCSKPQLEKYARIAKHQGEKRTLVFICSSTSERAIADGFEAGRFSYLSYRTLLWRDVFKALAGIQSDDRTLGEFLDFMKKEGLGPDRAISLQEMRDFMASRGFKERISRYCQRLLNEQDWGIIPNELSTQPIVQDRWGRTAVLFAEPKWKYALSIGFLYDPKDHRVQLVDPENSVDLMIRIEANPATNPRPTEVLDQLQQSGPKLRALGATVQVKVVPTPASDNKHTLILIRKSLRDVIAGAESDDQQIELIYVQIRQWLGILFSDPCLESALSQLKAG
jgi:hypothetical protein